MPLLTGIAIVAGGIALVTASGRTVRATHRVARGFFRMIDDWVGEPARPGVPARPGFPERLATLERDVRQICQEFHPDTGGLRDAVDRVEAAGHAYTLTHDRKDTP